MAYVFETVTARSEGAILWRLAPLPAPTPVSVEVSRSNAEPGSHIVRAELGPGVYMLEPDQDGGSREYFEVDSSGQRTDIAEDDAHKAARLGQQSTDC
ncbi:MAG: hypothetical protein ACTS27_03365 [Phycisphaerales bacterium]